MTNKKETARFAALQILTATVQNDAYANIELSKYFNQHQLANADKALATELVYGTLRYAINIDYILSKFMTKKTDKLPVKLLCILRMGVYQLLYMDKIPTSAAVNESVTLAKTQGFYGLSGMVNGVLRNVDRNRDSITYPDIDKEPAKHISIKYSHPLWLVEYWLKRISVEQCVELCRFDNGKEEMCLRVNTLRGSVDNIKGKLNDEGIAFEPAKYSNIALRIADGIALQKTELLKKGELVPQQESAQLAAIALAPKAGSKVIDACAAPGGKTTQLAAAMGNKGEILAFDIHQHRVDLINDNCRRQGVKIVKAEVNDACLLGEKYPDYADYALCDVPCTGLGTLRQRADARMHKKYEDIAEMADLGYKILCSVAKTVKAGGVLVYSTCTLTDEENNGNIDKFLNEHSEWQLEAFPAWTGPAQQKDGVCEIWPQQTGLDGFFIARLRRNK